MPDATVLHPATAAPDVLARMHDQEFERVLLCNDSSVGLQAIIAIHSTALGPANGGARMYPYGSFEDAAADAMRLARAMTYKWAAAGENRGGGKAVIIGDPKHDKSEALLRRFGRFVDSLAGEYWVGEDAGLTLDDMTVVHVETDYVATLPLESGGVGDIAPSTAYGVIQAMRACAQRAWGSPDLAGRRIAVQGVGACGANAVELLLEAGAHLWLTDVDEQRLAPYAGRERVEIVAPDDIYGLDVEIFAPFALGGVLNDETLPQLRATVVAGSTNNVLAREELGVELERRGIVHAVDFIANAGGAVHDADQFRKGGFRPERVRRSLDRIYDRTLDVFARAEAGNLSYYDAARGMAEERLRTVGSLRGGARA